MPQAIPTTSTVEINSDRRKAFATAIPADLTKVLLPKGPLPGVRKVADPVGTWSAVGDSRRVIMTDGSSLLETLTSYKPDDRVAYHIQGFKGPLGVLVTHAEGEWKFTSLTETKTNVRWTFTFFPRSNFTAPIVGLIANRLWPDFAGDALQRVKAMAESGEKS